MCYVYWKLKGFVRRYRSLKFKVNSNRIIQRFNMYRIIPLFVLCLCALTEATITTCGASFGNVDLASVRVTNCNPNDDKCVLVRGTDVSIQFNFQITKPVEHVKAVVHGIMMNLPIPFPLPDSDVCKNPAKSGVQCPLLPDQGPFHYKTSLPVMKSYPKVAVDIKWELQNENGEDIACLMIPARLK